MSIITYIKKMNAMRRKVATTALICIFFSGLAVGQKCKYKKNYIDEFTKVRVTETNSAGITFTRQDNNYFITAYKTFSGFTTVLIGENDALLLKFKNDSVIKLWPDKPYFGERIYSSGYPFTNISPTYRIDSIVLAQIEKESFIKYRINFTEIYTDELVEEYDYEDISWAAHCILILPPIVIKPQKLENPF